MITFKTRGNFSNTNKYLERLLELNNKSKYDKYGQMGVEALSAATPILTGRAASSWYYKIEHQGKYDKIVWCNSDIEGGCNVALLIQYGHGTKQGAYIQGRDYINPAIRPIFEQIIQDIRKEVSR